MAFARSDLSSSKLRVFLSWRDMASMLCGGCVSHFRFSFIPVFPPLSPHLASLVPSPLPSHFPCLCTLLASAADQFRVGTGDRATKSPTFYSVPSYNYINDVLAWDATGNATDTLFAGVAFMNISQLVSTRILYRSVGEKRERPAHGVHEVTP